jgi:hypothetical protein
MDQMPDQTREARLRPEFAAHYPCIEPDAWTPAVRVVEAIDHTHGQGAARYSAQLRLPPEHFEFRGGGSRGPEIRLRTRAADPETLH